MSTNESPTPLAAGTVSPLLPAGMIVLLGSLWGIAFSFSKMAVEDGVHPVSYTFWQALIAGGAVALVCLATGRKLRFDKPHLRHYLTMGLLGIALPNVNLVAAIDHLPAGVMVLAIPFVPLITYVLAIGMGMERFDVVRFSGVVCGLGGVALIVLPDAGLPDAVEAPWFLIALITPALYALSNVLAARLRPPGSASLPLAAGMMLTAGLFLAPAVFALDVLYLPSLPLGGAEFGMMGQIAISSVTYLIFFEVVRLAGPVIMSFTGYIVTLTGIGWGILFFDERHSAWVWGAAALIFTGMLLVNLRRNGGAVAAAPVPPDGPSR